MASNERSYTGEKPEYSQSVKACAFPNHIQRHERLHGGEKPNETTQCGEKPYECNQCGKALSQQGYIQIHNITIAGEKLDECNQCGKAYAYNSSAQVHLIRNLDKAEKEGNI
ncbi:zinc finger protein [Cricetulus griseus]|uniref:Zinc finger protein n=1 Tax=Cricetulus griseus TaxID=10029 RepID=A0A061HZG9_CRIGR|nr:zinc finger protein [Cricetulus griseus]